MSIIDLRKIIALKKIHAFETQPLKYIHLSKLEMLNQGQYTKLPKQEQEYCLNKLILKEFKLLAIDWSKIAPWQILTVVLSKAQRDKLYHHILLDMLLHQASSLINGRIVKGLYSLFSLNEKNFHSALATNLAQSKFIHSGTALSLTHNDLTIIYSSIARHFCQQLDVAIKDRVMLSYNIAEETTNYFNYANDELLLLFQFHAENVFPAYFDVCNNLLFN